MSIERLYEELCESTQVSGKEFVKRLGHEFSGWGIGKGWTVHILKDGTANGVDPKGRTHYNLERRREDLKALIRLIFLE